MADGPTYIAPQLWPLAIPIDSVNLDAANARKHPEKNMAAIVASLSRFGQRAPIVVQKQGMIVRAGNGRVEAAKSLGWKSIAAVVVDESSVDATAFAIADNRTAELAEWDNDVLASLLNTMPEDDLAATGFDKDDLAELLSELTPEILEVEEDTEPEVLSKAVSNQGDLWLLGQHRLLCGDSTKQADGAVVCACPPIGCFTSPPYAEQRKDTYGGRPAEKYNEWWVLIQACVKDVLADNGSFFVNIKPHCENGQRSLYVFDLVTQMVRGWSWRFVEEYAWNHEGTPINPAAGRFKNAFEPVYHFAVGDDVAIRPQNVMHESDRVAKWVPGRGNKTSTGNFGINGDVSPGLALPSNVVEVNKGVGRDDSAKHPAKFPTGLPAFFIQAFSDVGDAWFEPFSGSGTTLIACEQLGRKCYAIEIEPRYVDVAIRRWEKLTGKQATLEATGQTWAEVAAERGVTVA